MGYMLKMEYINAYYCKCILFLYSLLVEHDIDFVMKIYTIVLYSICITTNNVFYKPLSFLLFTILTLIAVKHLFFVLPSIFFQLSL